jgi:transposase-like protein
MLTILISVVNTLKVKTMRVKTFTSHLNYITQLLLDMTPAQREQVQQQIQETQPEITVNELIQPVFDISPQCPYCHSLHFNKWGKSGSLQRYRCKECAKTFNIKTKTPLARLHKCELWKQYIECMELKLTLRQAAKICNINLKTAFLWRHRFLDAQSEQYKDKLSGVIEVDEFFLAYSEKGAKKLAGSRAARKRGGQTDKRTRDGQVAVLLSIDRSKHMIDGVLAADTAAEIKAHLEPHIIKNSVLCSDGAWAYVDIAKKTNCDHKRLISSKNRVQDKIYHIQTVNGAIAHFKGWIDTKMRGVATKYLPHYLAWFRESYAKLDFQQMLVAAYR